ncbi:hypothetical protein [Actinomadura harenae]|uniref:Type II toxin-antitoxin system RelE/ParE family toxin n=1 Tax=Actinomadura harenae TaxID=2483351 RepID=A0A3M2ME49_9ACTN|nr:hypothetical protein [Actinomadura harenae]RMI47260.1 hypothetical protein EBO15_03490 [Actinomadura harenae]
MEQATEYLLGLATARSKRKRRQAFDVAILLEELGATGVLENPLQHRQLEGELWELKTTELRLPYYELMDAEHGRIARITHVFEKAKGKTAEGKIPRAHIRRGLAIIEEDRKC